VTLCSLSALLLLAQNIIQQCSCEREGLEYEKTTEIILSISVSNYIVTSSLFDGWPKIDEGVLVNFKEAIPLCNSKLYIFNTV
jgi:hypothetical protein